MAGEQAIITEPPAGSYAAGRAAAGKLSKKNGAGYLQEPAPAVHCAAL
jgi:hypothetical protein